MVYLVVNALLSKHCISQVIKYSEICHCMLKMVLAGLRPEIIMDITSRALTFWHYQMYQELQYQKALNKRSCDNLTQAEETYTTEIMKLNALLQKEKRNTEGKCFLFQFYCQYEIKINMFNDVINVSSYYLLFQLQKKRWKIKRVIWGNCRTNSYKRIVTCKILWYSIIKKEVNLFGVLEVVFFSKNIFAGTLTLSFSLKVDTQNVVTETHCLTSASLPVHINFLPVCIQGEGKHQSRHTGFY